MLQPIIVISVTSKRLEWLAMLFRWGKEICTELYWEITLEKWPHGRSKRRVGDYIKMDLLN
jgi:hypothetical protein